MKINLKVNLLDLRTLSPHQELQRLKFSTDTLIFDENCICAEAYLNRLQNFLYIDLIYCWLHRYLPLNKPVTYHTRRRCSILETNATR